MSTTGTTTTTIYASTVGATLESGEYVAFGETATIWYSIAIPQAGFGSIDTHGSSVDTVITLYVATGPGVRGLLYLVANDDCPGFTDGSSCLSGPNPGQSVNILQVGVKAQTGRVVINVSFIPATATPSASPTSTSTPSSVVTLSASPAPAPANDNYTNLQVIVR